jgi:hypothetical protein
MSELTFDAEFKALAKEKGPKLSKAASERVEKAGRESLNEQRREARFTSPQLENESKGIYEYQDASGGYGPTRIPVRMKKGGAVKSASARADGCCVRGKTRA